MQDALRGAFSAGLDGAFDALDPGLWDCVRLSLATVMDRVQHDTEQKSHGAISYHA